jgi:drug/metabolite transporter (DMT)-like permease
VDWKREPKTWIAIAVTLVLWASAFAGIRAGMRITAEGTVGPGGYGPGEVALLRFGTASIVLAIYAAITRMRMPDKRDMARIALAGFLGITIYHVALNFGEVSVSAGAASLIIAAGPVFTALLSTMFLKERLTVLGWVGILIAFAGVAVISLGQSTGGLSFTPGALLILLSAISTASYFIVSKRPLRHYSAIEFTTYVIWAGTIPLLVFLPGFISQFPQAAPSATLAVVYLGVFPAAIAYVLWSYALARMPASLLSAFLYLSPVLAMAIAWVWIGEIPTALTVAGGLVAIVGVVLVQTKGAKGNRPSSEPSTDPVGASDV